MIRIRAYAVAAHAGPTLAVTVIMTVFAWSAGWRGLPLALLAATRQVIANLLALLGVSAPEAMAREPETRMETVL